MPRRNRAPPRPPQPSAGTNDSDDGWERLTVEEAAAGGEEAPMPQGWEARTTEAGRRFYINHITKSTQWERPVANAALPRGWEQRTDSNGRVFYIDHINRRTQWNRPVSQPHLEQEEGNARNTFFNRRPISQDDTPSANTSQPPASQSPAATPAHQTARPPPATVAASGDASRPAAGASSEPLPPGWQMASAPNGRHFFINHNNQTTSWNDPRITHTASDSNLMGVGGASGASIPGYVTSDDKGPLPRGWEQRTHSDGRTFFIDHNTRTTQWDDPRVKIGGSSAVAYNRDYKAKYDSFRSQLRDAAAGVPREFRMTVSRDNILEDSFNAIMRSGLNPEQLKTRLWINFTGDKAYDYGGLTREWFYLLSKEMFNPYYGLFQTSALDNYTLQINYLSGIANPDHLHYFEFIGRVAGMAAYHGKLLDGFFIRPFYKMMLDKKMTLEDVESVDKEYYNSLVFIRDDDPECLDMFFTVTHEEYGITREVELKDGGQEIALTEENKLEYIDLVIDHRFVKRVQAQMNAFKKGFNSIVPLDLLKIFDEKELELLLCGLQEIDVKDWRSNTRYKGGFSNDHRVIGFFWKAVEMMSNEQRARLLQFVTGTSRVPMNGFRELWGSNGPCLFCIERWGDSSRLPRAHTCFNRIDLPAYSSFEDLNTKLTQAVEYCSGFEGVD